MSVLDPISSLPIGPEVPAHAAPRPEHRVLTGRLIRLEPLDPDRHGASLWRETHGVGAAERWQYLFDAPFAEEKPFRDFLARKAASTDPLFYAIVDQSSGFAVGFEALMRIDTAHRCIEVGNILYGKSLQRKPGATEAQYLLMRYVFEELGYRRYEWKCNALNEPSRRAAVRLGFTFEGIFRQHMIVRGRNRDTAWYSMLDDEWPAAQAAFERWLLPSNFDSAGVQRHSLAAGRVPPGA
ncbi:MAG: GNAT family N-acetyltransferase [Pseudomonadota bacterium]|nr:GNAT family N-acetyltransferase [Pseudomonadota bacterium]